MVRATGGGRAALLPLAGRGLRARRPAARRARAGVALGEADDPLRPRLPATAAEDALLVPQAPARVQARRRGEAVPAPLRAGHPRPGEGVRSGARARAGGGRATGRRRAALVRSWGRRGRPRPVVAGPRRLPGAAPLRVLAPRVGRV